MTTLNGDDEIQYPNEDNPEPIVFEISDGDVTVRESADTSTAKSSVLSGAVSTARGSAAPARAAPSLCNRSSGRHAR